MAKRGGKGPIKTISRGVGKANNALGQITAVLDQQSQALQQIQSSAQSDNNSSQNDAKVLMSIKIQQAQLELQKDQVAFLKKISESSNKQIEALQKGNKDWKTVGDKFKDLKRNLQDALDPNAIKKAILGPFSMFRGARNKMEDLDYIKRMKALGSTKSDKDLKEDSKKQRSAKYDALRAQDDINRLKKMGATDEQIANSKALKKRDDSLKTYNSLNQVSNKSSRDSMNPMGGNVSIKSAPLIPAENADLTTLPTKVTNETQTETLRIQSAISDNIKRVADNTDILVDNKKQDKKQVTVPAGGLGDILGNVMGLLSSSILTAIKSVFSVGNLLKVVSKVFAPALIIGSLFNGIMDGFDAWKKTGSISEALIAGVGGVLKFLSFGLFDQNTVRSIVTAVNGFVTTYIVDPVTSFVNSLGNMFDVYIAQPIQTAFQAVMNWGQDLFQLLNDYLITPISNAIKPIKDFFAEMAGNVLEFLRKIEIPGISFKVPAYGDVSFGPWRPFNTKDTKSEDTVASAPKPMLGSSVISASKNIADEQAKIDSKGSKPAGSSAMANIQQNNSQTTVMKPPVRNNESSYNRYIMSRF